MGKDGWDASSDWIIDRTSWLGCFPEREVLRIPSMIGEILDDLYYNARAVYGEKWWFIRKLFYIQTQEPLGFVILKTLGSVDLNVSVLSIMTWNARDDVNIDAFLHLLPLENKLASSLLFPVLLILSPSLYREHENSINNTVMLKVFDTVGLWHSGKKKSSDFRIFNFPPQ